MPKIVSNTYTTTQTLTNPATDNPATVTSTGFINVYNTDAVFGSTSAPWLLTNLGTIAGTGTLGDGVHLAAGGTVTNAQSGSPGASITAPVNGVEIDGSAGTVNNFGRIAGPRPTGIGVLLDKGGAVTNGAGVALISGAYNGIYAGAGAAAIANFGTIEAPGSIFNGGIAANVGVFLGAGGTVQNGTNGSTAGLIEGYHIGVFAGPLGGATTISNFGTIAANGTHCNDAAGGSGPEAGVGILLATPSEIHNGASGETSALIEGYYRGIGTGYTGLATIVNFGTIESTQTGLPVRYFGVATVLHNGGTITNYGLIKGVQNGVWVSVGNTLGAPGTITNLGTIEETSTFAVINGHTLLPTAVELFAGGTVTNGQNGSNAGLIAAGWDGVVLVNLPGSVVNFGTIESTATSPGPAGFSAAGVILAAGGTVMNGARGATGAVIQANETGVYVGGFEGAVTPGAIGAVINYGTITGSVGVSIAPGDTGNNTIVNFGTITGTSGIAIELGSGDDQVVIESGSVLQGAVANFHPGDSFDLPNMAFDSAGSANLLPGNALQIIENGSTFTINLDPSQDFTADTFQLANDGFNGTVVIEDNTPCYCLGTMILTPQGEVAVEELAIGDRVVTRSGAERAIKWIGHRSYRQLFIGDNQAVMPVVIKAGALAEGVPRRDLYVSPEHAMLIEEVLIPAGLLVNGMSVLRCPQMDPVRYFHIELDRHDVILADGAPAETFVDCDSRLMFHNAAEFAALYPGDTSPAWAFCAPRVAEGATVRRIWRAIAARAGWRGGSDGAEAAGRLEGSLDRADGRVIAGWAWVAEQPGVPVELEVLDGDGVIARVVADRYRGDLEKAGIGNGRHSFELILEPALSPWQPHTIHVRRAGDKAALIGSPTVLAALCGPALVSDQRFGAALEGAVRGARDPQDLDDLLHVLLTQTERVRRLRAGWRADRATPRRGKRALVIDDQLPDGERDAGSNAVLGHIQALIGLGYAVEFVPARQLMPDHPAARARVASLDVVWHLAPWVSSVEEVLRHNAGGYDLVYLHRVGNALSYAGVARAWCPQARILYSVADLHHLRLARQAEVQGLPELLVRASAVKEAELLAMRLVDAVITHSEAEAAYLAQVAPGVRVHVVPWPVQPQARRQALSERSGVVFLGGYSHPPNPDAVLWLMREIMPRVWERDAGIACLIVGQGWPQAEFSAADPRLRLVGPVRRLGAVFDKVRVSVAPLRFGAGIKGKVLDSLAAGVPCVMSPAAAEGLPLDRVLKSLVGHNAEEIAALVLRLHADAAANTAASRAGLAMIARNFSLEETSKALQRAAARPTDRPTSRVPRLFKSAG